MNEKILITGGAGYLGSVMVPNFLELGYKVTVIDNFFYKQTGLNSCCHHENFEIIYVLSEKKSFNKQIDEIEKQCLN